jgi:glycerol-3-phosphate O-acyltransferase
VNYIEEIARQIRAAVPASKLPDDDTHALFRMYAVLALAKGESVNAADVHNAWVSWMLGREPDHESLVPYDRLPCDVAEQDAAYVAAIRSVARVSGS